MNFKSDLSAGSVVTLKSGGPKMTVVHVNEDRTVHVVWLSQQEASKSAIFPEAALDRA